MKNILKISFLLLCFLSTSTVQSQTTRNLDYFNKVSARSNVKVKLIHSNEHKVIFKFSGEDDDNVITTVKNDELVVKVKKNKFGWNNKAKAAVKVYYTDLKSIEAKAGASIKAEESIQTSELDVVVSSGSVVDIEVEAELIDVEVLSGARALIEGKSTNGRFDASSGAHIDALRLICDNAKAEASSGASIKLHVNKKLAADATSGGMIKYRGDVEQTNIDSGWSGQIKKIN